MILTEEFLKNQNACAEGIQIAFDNNYIGQEYSNVIRELIAIDQKDFAGWMLAQKTTEAYVRANGKEFTMGTTYKIFNPLTGLHTEYQTEADAKVGMAEICKQVLQSHKPTVCQTISNENGDSTWIAVEIANNINVVVE
jgi:hypothetical protein